MISDVALGSLINFCLLEKHFEKFNVKSLTGKNS